jgi:general secretion pathway protein D
VLAAPKYRLRGLFVHVALAAAVLAGGCSQHPGTNLIDQVRNADLSEQKPRPVRQANADPNQQPKRQSETFPGDDSFGEQLTSASVTSASAPGAPRSGAQAAVYRTRLQQGGDGYQLNFENASLAEVVKVILGDTLRLPYHYDPRVQGQVTLSTG